MRKHLLVTPESGPRSVDLPDGLRGPGGKASLDPHGNVQIADGRVRHVGIANIAEVVEYRIAAIVDSVSHYVRFCNGGELYYVFNRRGEVVELTGRAVTANISSEGDYVFGAWIGP
jgi:hypothetical protein